MIYNAAENYKSYPASAGLNADIEIKEQIERSENPPDHLSRTGRYATLNFIIGIIPGMVGLFKPGEYCGVDHCFLVPGTWGFLYSFLDQRWGMDGWVWGESVNNRNGSVYEALGTS